MRNENVLSLLPSSARTGWIPAYLLSEKGEVLYEFLYNPESLEHSFEIRHNEAETALTSVQNQQYGSTSGKTLRLNDLLMESWSSQKSLRPLLDKLRTLSIADPTNEVYAPPIVYFAWGSYISPPCVLTDSVSWTETAWLGGEPAEVRLSLTLKEVPPPQPITTQPAAPGSQQTPLLESDEEAEAAQRVDTAVRVITNSIVSLVKPTNTAAIERKSPALISTAQALVNGSLPQRPQRQRVTVKAGDSIYSLAKQYLGSRDRWRELAAYNDVPILDGLGAGEQLIIPLPDEVKQIAGALAQVAPNPIASVINSVLDLSPVKQPHTGDYSLISWLL